MAEQNAVETVPLHMILPPRYLQDHLAMKKGPLKCIWTRRGSYTGHVLVMALSDQNDHDLALRIAEIEKNHSHGHYHHPAS